MGSSEWNESILEIILTTSLMAWYWSIKCSRVAKPNLERLWIILVYSRHFLAGKTIIVVATNPGAPPLPWQHSILQNLGKTLVLAVLPPLATLSMHNACEISIWFFSCYQCILWEPHSSQSQTTRRRYKNYLHQPRLDTLIEFITKSHNGVKVVLKSHLISYMLISSEVLGNIE